MKDFYVYLFMREDFASPYYVGKGSGNRCFQGGGRNCRPPQRERIIKIKEGLTEEEALTLEAKLILFWGRKCDGGVLQNISEGYDKPPSHKGKKWSEERKKKMSELMKANNQVRFMRGKGGAKKGNHNRRKPCPVTLEGITYPSQTAAAEALGTSRQNIINWTTGRHKRKK